MDLLKVSANNFMQFKYTIKKERDYFFYSQNNNKIACCLNNKKNQAPEIIEEVKK